MGEEIGIPYRDGYRWMDGLETKIAEEEEENGRRGRNDVWKQKHSRRGRGVQEAFFLLLFVFRLFINRHLYYKVRH